MNSNQQDHLPPSSVPLTPGKSVEEDKKRERGTAKSRIPQMMSPPTVRRGTPSKKAGDCHSCETTRPKSATIRPAPSHPLQLLHGTRPVRTTGKDRPGPKRPCNLPKVPSHSFRPQTPVIKVPLASDLRTMLPRDDDDFSGCSNDRRSESYRRESKLNPADRRSMQLKIRWQENIAKFESVKRQLYEKQRGLLELYATLRTSHQELSDMGQTVYLPSSDELKIMNVAKLAPGQLLQLVAGVEASEIANATPPIDMNTLNEIPNNIVATCEKTLECRKELIEWFEDVMAKKMITKNILAKKIKEFKNENDEFKRALEKNKEDYSRFLNETGECFKKSVNDTLTNQLRFQGFASKLTEMNALNESLREKLKETHQQLASAANKSKDLEKELKEVKNKKRDHMSRADVQAKSKEDKIAQITAALEQANSKSLSLEKTVAQLREENQKMQASYDKKFKKLNECVDINTKLFEEITADRSKLLTEKQELQKQLKELCQNYEEALHDKKHESSSSVAKLIEIEKKYKDAVEDKVRLEQKIESLCAQLLAAELRFNEVSKKLTELEIATNDSSGCRREMENLMCQLASAKKELQEHKELIAKQKEALKDVERNWKNAVNLDELAKNNLRSKEKHISELETERSLLEQRLRESESKTKLYADELSNLKHHVVQFQKELGEFKNWEELQEMIKQRHHQLKEATDQNRFLTEALKAKETEVQQQVETITEQGQLIDEQETALKIVTAKNEEQSNIINLLKNDLNEKAKATIEFDQQIAEKNSEIETLLSNVAKRKQQISQLEKIILTLEKQTLKLSNQKRTARETISSLEQKLSEYKSCYMINPDNTESSAENLDKLINILEYELTNPPESQLSNSQDYLMGKLIERQSQRGTHNNFKDHHYKYLCQDNVPTKKGMCNNHTEPNEEKHKGDTFDGRKLISRPESSEFVAIPKMAVSATAPISKDHQNTSLPQEHYARFGGNANCCVIPNYGRDEKKIRMFKLAGHRLQ